MVLKEEETVYLTKNGHGSMVVMSIEKYSKLISDSEYNQYVEKALDEADLVAENNNEKYYSKYKSKFNLCGSISNKKDEKIADNYVVMGVDKFLTETKNPNSTKKLYFDIQLKDNRNIKDMVPELTKLSIEGNIAHNKGLIFTQLMQYAVWEKQQQFGSALGLF